MGVVNGAGPDAFPSPVSAASLLQALDQVPSISIPICILVESSFVSISEGAGPGRALFHCYYERVRECVREREQERERERERQRQNVCERETEREKKRERERDFCVCVCMTSHSLLSRRLHAHTPLTEICAPKQAGVHHTPLFTGVGVLAAMQ